MKERGIIFNGDMVRAILSGQKTQTRRAAKASAADILDLQKQYPHKHYNISCPFGEVGDRLWVRETCQAKELESGLDVVCYPADETEIPIKAHPLDSGNWIDLYRYRSGEGKLVPSIHMPRWASRITLEIIDVRVERLNDISERDAAREGLHQLPASGRYCLTPGAQYFGMASYSAKEVFSWLWQSIYGEESWASNPWCWVIEFRRIEGD